MAKTTGIAISGTGGTNKNLNITSGSTLTLSAGSVLDVSAFVGLTAANYAITDTLTIGAGAGTINDAVATLTLTETNIALVGATTVTGASLTVAAGAVNPGLVLTGAGNLSEAAMAVPGTHVADGGTYAFIADQIAARVSIEGTVYRIPLWADA